MSKKRTDINNFDLLQGLSSEFSSLDLSKLELAELQIDQFIDGEPSVVESFFLIAAVCGVLGRVSLIVASPVEGAGAGTMTRAWVFIVLQHIAVAITPAEARKLADAAPKTQAGKAYELRRFADRAEEMTRRLQG